MAKTPPRKKGKKPSQHLHLACPICGHGNYVDGRSLHVHIRRKHPLYKTHVDLQMQINVRNATKHQPKKCPHCTALRTSLARHVKVCPKRPELERQRAGTAQPGDPELTNAQFLAQYTERLRAPGMGVGESTALDYRGYISRMIEWEIRQDPDFRATDWFAGARSERFRGLRGMNNYILPTYGNASVQNLAASFKHLWTWIKVNILSLFSLEFGKSVEVVVELILTTFGNVRLFFSKHVYSIQSIVTSLLGRFLPTKHT